MEAESGAVNSGSEWASRGLALLEVTLVYVVVLVVVAGVTLLPLAGWIRHHLHRPFLEYLAMGAVVALVAGFSRVPLGRWGISGKGLAAQRDAALTCVLPFAVGKALTYPLGPRAALHSLVEPVIAVGVIAACAWLLRNRPASSLAAAVVGLALAMDVAPARALTALVFFAVFLGPIEELLFRGYMQSRLNEAWGRPWRLGAASCGAGLLITAGLFSVFHVLNLPALFAGRFEPLWVTAIPTFAWGLAFGFLRERTGSLVPPALAHGVPQAIAWAVLGR